MELTVDRGSQSGEVKLAKPKRRRKTTCHLFILISLIFPLGAGSDSGGVAAFLSPAARGLVVIFYCFLISLL